MAPAGSPRVANGGDAFALEPLDVVRPGAHGLAHQVAAAADAAGQRLRRQDRRRGAAAQVRRRVGRWGARRRCSRKPIWFAPARLSEVQRPRCRQVDGAHEQTVAVRAGILGASGPVAHVYSDSTIITNRPLGVAAGNGSRGARSGQFRVVKCGPIQAPSHGAATAWRQAGQLGPYGLGTSTQRATNRDSPGPVERRPCRQQVERRGAGGS